MSFEFKEDLLQFIWEHQLFDTSNLVTIAGEKVSVLKQGLLNKNSGPDFENAKIRLDETEFHGAVEIHQNSNDWYTHNHDADVAYNKVVLHVCYKATRSVKRQDGSTIPTIELQSRIRASALHRYQGLMVEKAFIPCAKLLGNVDSFTTTAWLERMLVERIEERCSTLKNYLEKTKGNWNYTFYVAVVKAFGMPINKDSFEELAFALPYEIVQKHSDSLFQLEALFFGTAGLLKAVQSANSYTAAMQNEYAFLASKYGLSTISTPIRFGKMRPMSLPTVKLAQLAALWHNSPNLVSDVLSLAELPILTEKLTFETSDFWQNHYSLHKESKVVSKQLSPTAIQLLLLNAIIPFAFFYFQAKGSEDEYEKAIHYLTELKAEKNSIIVEWQKLGVQVDSAFNSQALLHLYKSYCSKKMCLECNIGRKILLKEVQ